MVSHTSYPFCLLVTFTLSLVSTAVVLAAIVTDHWEEVTYDTDVLARIVNVAESNDSAINMYRLRDGVVVMENAMRHPPAAVFLVPVSGGIWRICDNLSDSARRILAAYPQYEPRPTCYYYLSSFEKAEAVSGDMVGTARTSFRRIQNSAISLAIVAIILLVVCCLLGLLGVWFRQVPAIMIAGFIYGATGTFTVFAIFTIRSKINDQEQRLYGGGGFFTPHDYLPARVHVTGWSVEVAIGGAVCCQLAALSWLVLSHIGKQMRPAVVGPSEVVAVT